MARTAGSKGEVTETAILDAARRLISTAGFEASSIRTIAQEAGVTSGALYRYFPSKTAILFCLLDRHLRELLAAWRQEDPGLAVSATDRLSAFICFHLRYHIPRREDVFLSYRELRGLDATQYTAICQLRDQYEAVLVGLIDAATAAGEASVDDAKLATRAIISMLTGVTQWYRDDGPLDIEAVQAQYLALVLHGVRGS